MDADAHQGHRRGTAGKLVGHEITEEAAKITLAGMDPIRYLETDDPVLRLAMQATAARVFQIRAEANKNG